MDAPLVGFPPVARADARVLILGSMPGAASLAAGEYYAHPRNQFWPIMAALCGAAPELPYAQRTARLRAAGIALWDVLHSCRRRGSLDAAIELRDAVANDLPGFLRTHRRVGLVLFNGALAARLWQRRCGAPLAAEFPALELHQLPSTSPANASWPAARKLQAWRAALAGRTDA